MSKKPRFRTLLDSQHAKGCQTLLKRIRHQFYQMQMILSMNQKVFSQSLAAYVKSKSNFEYFEKNI